MNSLANNIAHGRDETSTVLNAARGTILYHQDDPAPFHFDVLSGVIRTIFLFPDGRRQITGFFFAGEVFGADQGFYKTSAEVVSDCAEVRRHRWGESASDERALSVALELVENSVLLLGRRTALSRVAALLVDIQARTGGDEWIPLPMSRVDIADYLGLTVETVSRTFSRMTRTGLVAQDEHHLVRLADPERLSVLAGAEGGRAHAKSGCHQQPLS